MALKSLGETMPTHTLYTHSTSTDLNQCPASPVSDAIQPQHTCESLGTQAPTYGGYIQPYPIPPHSTSPHPIQPLPAQPHLTQPFAAQPHHPTQPLQAQPYLTQPHVTSMSDYSEVCALDSTSGFHTPNAVLPVYTTGFQ